MKTMIAVLLVLLLLSFGQAQQTWTRAYGGVNDDEGYSVQQTSDGGYIVAGYTMSFGNRFADVYLIKTNASGDTQPMAGPTTMRATRSSRPQTAGISSQATPCPSARGRLMSISSRPTH